jgi:hypothetical protein
METTGRETAPEATIVPLLEEDELRMHGDNERTPVASLGWAAEYLFGPWQPCDSLTA